MPRRGTTLPSLGDTALLTATTMGSPIGELILVAGPVGLRAVLWPGEEDLVSDLPAPGSGDDDPAATRILHTTIAQLTEYFDGRRSVFEIPLDPVGTSFQRSVWAELGRIPYGETITYGEQARRLGDPRKARAVGSANGRNPISIVVPCHRVVGADGTLTGYAGGTDTKAWLLRHEGADSPARQHGDTRQATLFG